MIVIKIGRKYFVEEKNCRLLVELDYSPDHTPPSPPHKINPGIYGVAEQPSSRTSGQAAEARAEKTCNPQRKHSSE
jgi:hypothetical protein